MEKKDVLKFEEDTRAYTFGFHQNLLQYLDLLKLHGYTLEDVKRYIPARIKFAKEEEKKAEKIQRFLERKCPECSGLMLLFPVNIDPGTQTGDPEDNTVWFCQVQACQETIYNKDTIDQIVKKGLASKKKKRPPRYRK